MILLFRVLLIDISNHFRPFVSSLEIKFKNNFSLCDYVLSVFFFVVVSYWAKCSLVYSYLIFKYSL